MAHLRHNQFLILLLVFILAIGGWLFVKDLPAASPVSSGDAADNATDFSQAGIVMFNSSGLKQNVPYLNYEEPGRPELTKELVLDALSVCAAENGAVPCIAMSVTLDMPFGGKRALVEGINQADGTVLVRKLQALKEGAPAFPVSGRVFISWPQAVSLIESCKVTMIMQAHSLDVSLTLVDGSKVVAVEPMIDEVFSVFERSRSVCGENVPIATE